MRCRILQQRAMRLDTLSARSETLASIQFRLRRLCRGSGPSWRRSRDFRRRDCSRAQPFPPALQRQAFTVSTLIVLSAFLFGCRRGPPPRCIDKDAMRALVVFADPSFKLKGHVVCGSRAAPVGSETVVDALVLVGNRGASGAWLLMALNRVDSGPWTLTESLDQPSPSVRPMTKEPSDADISRFAREAPWVTGAPIPDAGCATKVAPETQCD
jgi:hypothetical protein